jgi:hypothetical protein
MGPEVAFGVMGPRARRGGAAAASAVYGAIATARARIVYPALVLQVASGVALIVVQEGVPLRAAWLRLALALYGIAIALVAFVLTPASAGARRALASGTPPGDPSLRQVWARTAAAGGVAGTLLTAVAVLMVWKPVL